MAQKKRSSDRPSSSASLSLASRDALHAAAASPSIGPGVQRLRTQRGLSHEALAEQVGLSATELADIESGASEPSIDLTWSIANALGVSFSALVQTVGHEFGIAVLVTSHLLGELERVSDNVVVLDGGRLLRSSATTEGWAAT